MTMRQLIRNLAKDYLDEEMGLVAERTCEAEMSTPSIDDEILDQEGFLPDEEQLDDIKKQILRKIINLLVNATPSKGKKSSRKALEEENALLKRHVAELHRCFR
jgi:hypothetical protein